MRIVVLSFALAYGCTTSSLSSGDCAHLDPEDCTQAGHCHLEDYVGSNQKCRDADTGAASSGSECNTLGISDCTDRTDCTTVYTFKDCSPVPTPNCIPDGIWAPTSCK